jgi:hypothetical protein
MIMTKDKETCIRKNFFEVVVDSLDVVQVDGENLVVQYTSPTMHSEAQYLGKYLE